MKFLQIIAGGREFLKNFYDARPDMSEMSSRAQTDALIAAGVAAGHVFPPYLRPLGYDAELIVLDCRQSQSRWAVENGVDIQPADLRRTAAAQIERMRPDVVYVVDPGALDWGFFGGLAHRPALSLFRPAGPPPAWANWSGFDAVLSDRACDIDKARELGVPFAERLLPGCPTFIVERMTGATKTDDVVFSGRLDPAHRRRAQHLLEVGKAPLGWRGDFSIAYHLHSAFGDRLPVGIQMYDRGPLWGMEMFQATAQGRIVLNPLDDHAEAGVAVNARTFEAVGAGSFVLTDGAAGADGPFRPGVEIETYSTPPELVEKIHHYLERPAEREDVARRGLERLLREHTMERRGEEMDAVIRRLSARRDGKAAARTRLTAATPTVVGPEDRGRLSQVAARLVDGGDSAAAGSVLRIALDADPEDADALFLLGIVEQRSGRRDEAARLIQAALAVGPDDWRRFAALAVVLHEAGRPEGAPAALREALIRNPRSAALHRQYAALLDQLGRQDEAAAHIRQAAVFDGGDPAPTPALPA